MKRHFLARSILASILTICCALPASGAGWTHLAGVPHRRAVAAQGPRDLDSVNWVAAPAPDEEFVSHASPLVSDGRVFALLRVFVKNIHDSNRLVCIDAADGQRLWSATLPPDALDSWSSPVIDERLGVIVAVSDTSVMAFRTADGLPLWTRTLGGSVVNASPAISGDLFEFGRPANRLLITDHSPFGLASMYAINVDAFDVVGNPHQPGEIVWTRSIEFLSGATPAYASGRVYVATTDGVVHAVDARDGSPIWQTPVPGLASFGGVSVYQERVYAAGYNFSGGQNNSRLAKLDASTGGLIWTVACERTDSIPIVIGDGRIVLAGGIAGFGSNVKVQSFIDHGSFAALQWDTFADSAGALSVGGWTTQPAYAAGFLYVGRPAPSGTGFPPYQELFILDTTRSPGSAQFVVDQHSGAGGTPAIAGPCVYSIGHNGLMAFCGERTPGDLAGDGPLPHDGSSPIEN